MFKYCLLINNGAKIERRKPHRHIEHRFILIFRKRLFGEKKNHGDREKTEE